jgi:hypothetical protein
VEFLTWWASDDPPEVTRPDQPSYAREVVRSHLGAVGRYYPDALERVFVKGLAGLSFQWITRPTVVCFPEECEERGEYTNSEVALAMGLGVGGDIDLGRSLSLTPVVDLAYHYNDDSAWLLFVTMAVTLQ